MTLKNTSQPHNPEKTSFGTQIVTPEEKTALVHGVFDNVAVKYDIMNDLMSGGVHRLWKNRLIREIRPHPHMKFLDVAGGTGDIAFRIQNKLEGKGDITICDLTHAMLSVGRDRAIDKGCGNKFKWSTGNAESLPFADNSFDVYTIAFGLRNVTHIDNALSEVRRALRPGGRFFCLEFSHVENPALKALYDIYSYKLIPQIGSMVAGDKDSYQYLVESIRKFPTPENLKQRMEGAGLKNCGFKALSGGIVALHSGNRL